MARSFGLGHIAAKKREAEKAVAISYVAIEDDAGAVLAQTFLEGAAALASAASRARRHVADILNAAGKSRDQQPRF